LFPYSWCIRKPNRAAVRGTELYPLDLYYIYKNMYLTFCDDYICIHDFAKLTMKLRINFGIPTGRNVSFNDLYTRDTKICEIVIVNYYYVIADHPATVDRTI